MFLGDSGEMIVGQNLLGNMSNHPGDYGIQESKGLQWMPHLNITKKQVNSQFKICKRDASKAGHSAIPENQTSRRALSSSQKLTFPFLGQKGRSILSGKLNIPLENEAREE